MGGGGTTIQAPTAPNYNESMRDVLKAQVEMAPEVYRSEARYQPLYNALQAQQQAFQAQQSIDMARQAYPQIADIEAAYNQANRQAELGQLQTALPQYQRAFNALTPGYAEAVAGAGQLAQSSMQQALNRPQFTSFEAGVRDPYGMPVGGPVQQFSPMSPVAQIAPQQQPAQLQAGGAQQAPRIQYNQGLEDRFKQLATNTQGAIRGPANLPVDPGAPIEPQRNPRAQPGYGAIINQAAIDAQNAKIAQYKNDLANYDQAEAARQAEVSQYLKNFNPAEVLAQGQAQPAQAAAQPPASGAMAPMQGQEQAPMSLASAVAPMQSRMGPPPPQNDLTRINQGIVNQYVGTMPGMGDYANYLADTSRRELEAGRGLTAEEQRIADQTARSAYAARGTALGGGAVGSEILNRSQVTNQRYQQRLANAQSAAGQIQAIYQPALQESFARQQAQQQYGLGAQQQAFQQAIQRGQAQQQSYMSGIQAQAAQAQLGAGAMGQLQAAQAPVLQAFYKQPILQGQEGQSQQMGLAMQQMAGPQLFNPESQTGMGSIYGAYNAQMNLAGAQAQANAAASAGKSGMIGAIGGGLLAGAGMAF